MLKIYTLLSNQSLLARYASGEGLRISLADLRSETFVQAWQRYDWLPDHRLKNALQTVYGDEETFWGFLRQTHKILTDPFLEWSGNTLCVKEESFGSWQDVIAEASPLDLIAFFISEDVLDKKTFQQRIRSNITRCPLPGFPAPLLDALLENVRQCDLHVHLNGSTFADAIWESALCNPLAFRAKMMHEWKDNKQVVEELFAQFSPHFGWRESATLVDIAANLRDWLVRRLLTPRQCSSAKGCDSGKECGFSDFFSSVVLSTNSNTHQCAAYAWRKRLWKERPLQNFVLFSPPIGRYSGKHPLCTYAPSMVSWCGDDSSPLQYEAIFYVAVFHALQKESDDYFARCFHYYILLKNFFRKLLVQQCSQVGFDQFQKITLTGIREHDESAYFKRLQQFEVAAGYKSRIHVEGRFAPKDTLKKLAGIKHKIDKDFIEYAAYCDKRLKNNQCVNMAELSLVAHFIKNKDDSEVPGCQYYNYRRKLMRQARTIVRYIDDERHGRFSPPKGTCRQPAITGFDAAANELDAPPEVFAPLYRFLRSHGHTNFTFHVGEDFQHLVSGIRAVEEAVNFLELGAGNRVGHATALGIDPALWMRQNEEHLRISIYEWLDTMVYALFALREGGGSFAQETSRLSEDIPKLCAKVYGKAYSVDCLHGAWKIRYLDPLVAFFDYNSGSSDQFLTNEWKRVCDAVDANKECFSIFQKYHSLPSAGCKKIKKAIDNADLLSDKNIPQLKYGQKRRHTIKDIYIKVPRNYFSEDALTFLQTRTLKLLKEKDIAIESLITSNVRISFYNNYDEHHILRWLKCNNKFQDEEYPQICLGTDDPGIFATSIRNECLHLLTMLRKLNIPEHKSIELISMLLANSNAYLFKEGAAGQVS